MSCTILFWVRSLCSRLASCLMPLAAAANGAACAAGWYLLRVLTVRRLISCADKAADGKGGAAVAVAEKKTGEVCRFFQASECSTGLFPVLRWHNRHVCAHGMR